MGNRICCKIQCCNGDKRRHLPILLLGLSGVGKTQIGHYLSEQVRTDFKATNGCIVYKIFHMGKIIRLTEIGGNSDIRDIWHIYYKNSMGIIFLIDSVNYDQLNDSRNQFIQLMSHPDIIGKPVVILATKQDLNNSMNVIDLTEWLEIELIANHFQTPCFIECSGISNYEGLNVAIKWIIQVLTKNFGIYNNRIKFSNTNIFHGKHNKLNYHRPSTATTIPVKEKYNRVQRPRSTPPHKNKICVNQISPYEI